MDDVTVPAIVGVVAAVAGFLLWRRLDESDEAADLHLPHWRHGHAVERPSDARDALRIVPDNAPRGTRPVDADSVADSTGGSPLIPVGPGRRSIDETPPPGWVPVGPGEPSVGSDAGRDECPQCAPSRAFGAERCVGCGRPLAPSRTTLADRFRNQ